MVRLDEDRMRMVRRNMLLGMWAAKKLGLLGESGEAYSRNLALNTLDIKGDVHAKLRKDFDSAGVIQSDEDIRRVMTEFWLQASLSGKSGGGDASDAATVQIARNLMQK